MIELSFAVAIAILGVWGYFTKRAIARAHTRIDRFSSRVSKLEGNVQGIRDSLEAVQSLVQRIDRNTENLVVALTRRPGE